MRLKNLLVFTVFSFALALVNCQERSKFRKMESIINANNPNCFLECGRTGNDITEEHVASGDGYDISIKDVSY